MRTTRLLWRRHGSRSAAAILAALITVRCAASLGNNPRPFSAWDTIQLFAAAVDAGHRATASQLVVGTSRSREEVDAIVDEHRASRSLWWTVRDRFGDRAAESIPCFSQRLAALVRDTTEVDHVDSCVLATPSGHVAVRLLRHGRTLKIDLGSIPELGEPGDGIERLRKATLIAGNIADDVVAGRYANPADIRANLIANLEDWDY